MLIIIITMDLLVDDYYQYVYNFLGSLSEIVVVMPLVTTSPKNNASLEKQQAYQLRNVKISAFSC